MKKLIALIVLTLAFRGLALAGAPALFADDQDGGSIQVFDSGLSPIATISGASTTLDIPLGLTTAGSRVWAANFSGPSVVAFPFTASGNVAPTVNIVGASTTLTGPEDIGVGPLTGKIYVMDGSEIDIFASGANGNVAPIANIGGVSTSVGNSVALDSAENVYSITDGQDGVSVYRNGTLGDVAPDVTITGVNVNLSGADNVRIDSANHVWTMDDFGVKEFPAIGASTGTIDPMPLVSLTNSAISTTSGTADAPIGTTFDAEGNIYVAIISASFLSLSGTVYEFASTATGGAAPIASVSLMPSNIAQCGGVAYIPTSSSSQRPTVRIL